MVGGGREDQLALRGVTGGACDGTDAGLLDRGGDSRPALRREVCPPVARRTLYSGSGALSHDDPPRVWLARFEGLMFCPCGKLDLFPHQKNHIHITHCPGTTKAVLGRIRSREPTVSYRA